MNSVLIIDDEEIIRHTIRKMGQWESFGMKVVGEAANGIDGLRMICEQKPDIVFLDMRMPGLSGAEVIEKLEERGIRLKLVVVSGFDSYTYTRMALRYGAVDYLLKPIDREEMLALLKRLQHVLALEENDQDGARFEGNTLAAVHRRIDANCCDPLTLESLASEFFLNKEYLSRAFKKRYGIGITALIHRSRLEIAKRLLLEGRKVGDVAQQTGYGDTTYFGRVFRKYEGLSPSEYVDAHKL